MPETDDNILPNGPRWYILSGIEDNEAPALSDSHVPDRPNKQEKKQNDR